ncbi:MAG: pseudouridine-5'-phosphate glycosidase [Gammaproteobacteria bacterium]|nr:pseudouridine-5'-phosphate glycosidase [Gammaproteobacteria bacterium]
MRADQYLDIDAAVSEALARNQPVVALESTIISHGMPHPQNVDTALAVEDAVRNSGAVPATIAIIDGRLKVGLSAEDIEQLGRKGQQVIKTSRRDLPFVVARRETGATTVATTMIIAALAGIRVFATGGIGGVHRGAAETMDVSADLEELARTNVAVVCAGVKSVLDIGKTLEYLETKGVPVIGYRTDELPAFYARSSGHPVDYRVDTAEDIAIAMKTKWALGLHGGIVIGNPVPDEAALDSAEIDAVIDAAIVEMADQGISGKETTPFLLARIAEKTKGRSLATNIALVLNNARIAANVAAAYSALQ